MELKKPPYGKTPKSFYLIDETLVTYKFISTMFDTEGLFIPKIYQAVVAVSSIKMNDTLGDT